MSKNNNKLLFIIISFIIIFFISYNFNITSFSEENYSGFENDLEVFSEANKSENNLKKESDQEIIVHLSGAVKEAGVYKLRENDRLVDLISAAGGLKEKADLEEINLAEPLFDGQKIVIPEIIKQKENTQIIQQENDGELLLNYKINQENKININRASQSKLEELSGIGPGKAAAIIEYRNKNGLFRKKEDLTNVSGIGEKTLEKIIEEISLK